MEYSSFFDDIETGISLVDAMKKQTDNKKDMDDLDILIHKVFEQNPDGKELMKRWTEAVLISTIADTGMDIVDIGIREGMKRFIRGIILTIRRVEGGR